MTTAKLFTDAQGKPFLEHADWAFAQASITDTVSGTYFVQDWVFSNTSNTDIWEDPTPDGDPTVAIKMKAGAFGVFLVRGTLQNVGGATNVFHMMVESGRAEGIAGQDTPGPDFSGYWKGTVWGGTQKPAWLRQHSIYRLMYAPPSITTITWGMRVTVVAGGSMSWTDVAAYLEVIKLGDYFEEVTLYG